MPGKYSGDGNDADGTWQGIFKYNSYCRMRASCQTRYLAESAFQSRRAARLTQVSMTNAGFADSFCLIRSHTVVHENAHNLPGIVAPRLSRKCVRWLMSGVELMGQVVLHDCVSWLTSAVYIPFILQCLSSYGLNT